MSTAGICYVAALGVSLLLVAASGVSEVALRYLPTSDLSYLLAGPRAILAGKDPYDPLTWPGTLGLFSAQDVGFKPAYAYPPAVAFALMPLAVVPSPLALAVWSIASLALASIALRRLLYVAVPDQAATHAATAVALVASQPAIQTLLTGQWTFFIVAFLSLALAFERRARAAWAGLAASALLIKPQLLLFTVPALILDVGRAQRRPFLLAFGGSAAVVLLATVWLRPDGWLKWATNVPLAGAGEPGLSTAWRVLGDGFGTAGTALTAALALLTILVLWRIRADRDAFLGTAIAASLVFAPYARAYDLLQCLVPLVLAARILARPERGRKWIGPAAIVLFAIATWILYEWVGVARRSETLNWLAGATVLLYLAIVSLRAPAVRALSIEPAR